MRQQYERLREEHGFRVLDYTVDADAASPRVCFQFSEDLPGRRTDFSPFVAVAGQDKPALSVQDRQLCVEGLRHGERYAVTLRAGIPSVVKETLSRSAEYSVYVRDRKPSVRFAGKAYVLPRTGQRGIPVVSVNATAVTVEIYRIGDRNLVGSVVGRDFQTSLDRYDLERLAAQRGFQVWKGEMAVEQKLNTDVTTAFPVDQAIGTIAAGVYVVVAEPAGVIGKDEYEALATQWFIVSDLGLTAFSGNDGIHAFVHSLDTARPKGAIEIRLMSRGNEILARKRSGDAGYVHFEANLTRGEGALSPAMLIAADDRGDYAFLNLKAPAFDLGDRGVSGRMVPGGLDAFVYAERGVYRSGETVQVTALLRDAAAAPRSAAAHAGGGAARRRRIPPQRRRRSGPGRALARDCAGAVGADRHLAGARLRRPQASAGRRGYLHGRGLCARPAGVRSRRRCAVASPRSSRAQITVEGRYLYGAPAAGLGLEGELIVAAGERAGGICRLPVRSRRRGGGDGPRPARGAAGDRRRRQGAFPGHAREGSRPPRGRWRRRSSCGWPSRAAVRSSASSPCR